MSRFNFFTRGAGGDTTTTTTNPNRNSHTDLYTTDPYSDRAPLSPHSNIHPSPPPSIHLTPAAAAAADDLEAAHPSSAAAAAATHEMAERNTNLRAPSFLHRFRPAIPSFFSSASTSTPAHIRGHPALRPSSSHYSESGSGLRGAPDTVVDLGFGGGRGGGGYGYGGLQSPKSDFDGGYEDAYRIGEDELDLPSTRLHLPELERTWTVGSNGPPTRPGTGAAAGEGVAEPERVVVRETRGGSRRERRRERSGSGSSDSERSGDRERRRRRRGERSGSGSGSGRSRRSERSGRSGSHRSRDDESRSERRARRERRHRREGERGSRTKKRSPPKHFLFCFPWIKSSRVRSQILRCFVSGMFVALTLSIYLSLSLTQGINSNEFTILLILVILFVTIFFCHSLIRLIMLVVKARKREQLQQQGRLPEMAGPGGYAIPDEPIPVVLARDEEAAGIESEVTKTGPPAYGVWRESVRADPNRLYWMRNQQAPVQPVQPVEVSDISSSGGSETGVTGSTEYTVSAESTVSSQSSGAPRSAVPRPPSYSSDDGVSYVVEARPRSIAPRIGPLAGSAHPPETRMSGNWF